MSGIKKTVFISEELIKESLIIDSSFSAVVEKKAIDSFGKWKKRKETSVDLTNNLRKENNRKNTNTNRSNRH